MGSRPEGGTYRPPVFEMAILATRPPGKSQDVLFEFIYPAWDSLSFLVCGLITFLIWENVRALFSVIPPFLSSLSVPIAGW